MKKVFFSMRTFEKDGGGSIRMYGVLNALAEKGHEVIFISNAKKLSRFHPAIKHISIDWRFSEKDKRIFQGLLGILPSFLMKVKYQKFLNHLKQIFTENKLDKQPVIFFEYLDNSIGYLLKRLNFIKSYINDIHGIATIEFQHQLRHGNTIKTRVINQVKYGISNQLDRKVFKDAEGFILASKAMEEYFKEQYPFIKDKQIYILPYVVSAESLQNKVDLKLKSQLLEKFQIEPSDFVFFFAGGFKPTAGVEDLIQAFADLKKTHKAVKLLVLGRGDAALLYYQALVEQLGLKGDVQFIDSVPYNELKTYQDLANVIVCPDRQNPYSELIVHLKYFDALASGKIVINGAFKSVKEINIDENLSLNFEPSNQSDLLRVMKNCIDHYEALKNKYANNQQVLANHLTYNKIIDSITQLPQN